MSERDEPDNVHVIERPEDYLSACELAGLDSAPVHGNDPMWRYALPGEIGSAAVLPLSAQQWLGVNSDHGVVFSDEESLPSLNDTGSSFADLADRIDAWVARQPEDVA